MTWLWKCGTKFKLGSKQIAVEKLSRDNWETSAICWRKLIYVCTTSSKIKEGYIIYVCVLMHIAVLIHELVNCKMFYVISSWHGNNYDICKLGDWITTHFTVITSSISLSISQSHVMISLIYYTFYNIIQDLLSNFE